MCFLGGLQGGQLHWMVDKVSDQALLNTAGWRFIIPQLYKKYPNEDMKLNITLTSPPSLKISRSGFEAKILSDMIVDVMDVKGDTSVACISMVLLSNKHAELQSSDQIFLGFDLFFFFLLSSICRLCRLLELQRFLGIRLAAG